MTILLLDDDFVIIEQLKCLMQLENTWKLVQHNEVNYDSIDLVIIDIFNTKYKNILEDILKVNPNVKTISISDQLTSNSSKGCEYCNCNYNRIRLIKPINLKQFYDSIKDFDKIPVCPLMDAFQNLENLIPIIIDQFKNLLYDEETQIISSTGDSESKEHTMQILALLALLDQNQIQYTLLNESDVKIHI